MGSWSFDTYELFSVRARVAISFGFLGNSCGLRVRGFWGYVGMMVHKT